MCACACVCVLGVEKELKERREDTGWVGKKEHEMVMELLSNPTDLSVHFSA